MQANMMQRGAARPVMRRLQAKSVIRAQATQVAGEATKAATKLPLVFVSAEVSPWSKTGGLGDVVGGLPIELAKRGHKVITVAPRYDQYSDAWDTGVVVKIDGQDVRFFHTEKQGVHRVWVDHPWFLAKVYGKTGSKLYGPKSGADYVDNHKRFNLFCKAAIEATKALPFGTGEECVFVANDWHSALVPVLLKDHYQPMGQFTKAKSALCVHNIAFQGRMWDATFKDLGLPQSSYEKFAFEDGYPKVYTETDPLDDEDEKPLPSGGRFKKVNWLKAGIISCDKLVTVSPNYATEIAQDAAGGVELDKFIREKGVTGIVNGMDVDEWDPRVDKYVPLKYDKTTVYAGKAAAKEALQAETGLPVDPKAPLFSFIGRLEEQKGVDILMEAIPAILAKAPNAQIVILGTGKAKFEAQVKALDKAGKGQVKGIVKFSAPLAHLITAGADFILVPSRFEPCGLIQLHAMQYGTVPVVSSTGGLVDTVKEGVTGFQMGQMDKDELVPADAEAIAATVARAAQAFSTPLFKEMVYNCISQDLSWTKPALKWEGVLESLFLGTPDAAQRVESIKVPVAETIPNVVAATDKPLTKKPAAAGAAAPAAGAAAAAPAPAAPAPSAAAAPKPAPVKFDAQAQAAQAPSTQTFLKQFAAFTAAAAATQPPAAATKTAAPKADGAAKPAGAAAAAGASPAAPKGDSSAATEAKPTAAAAASSPAAPTAAATTPAKSA